MNMYTEVSFARGRALDCTGYWVGQGSNLVNKTHGIILPGGLNREGVPVLSLQAPGVHTYFTTPAVRIEVNQPALVARTKLHGLSGLQTRQICYLAALEVGSPK